MERKKHQRTERNKTTDRARENERGGRRGRKRETEKEKEEYWTFSTEWSLKKS